MFRFVKKLGCGVNGQVVLVEQRSDWNAFAVKKLPIDNLVSKREIDIWKSLCPHDNIVQLINVHIGYNDYFVVMEPMLGSLSDYMRSNTMKAEHIESIFHEILRGLKYCHDRKVIHRDIKPDNILLNTTSVKICDFSLSCEKMDCMTNNVVTLWYKSPELLFGCRHYDESIDIWSAACVLYEMMTSRPPFVADENSEISQLKSICEVLGNPSHADMMNLKVFATISFHPKCKKEDYFANFPQFLLEVFIFDWQKRPSAETLLNFCTKRHVIFSQSENCKASLSESVPEDWKEIFSNLDALDYPHLL